MAKRSRSASTSRRVRSRRSRTFRKRVSRRRFGRSKRGRMNPSYKFHRWVTSIAQTNVTGCTYDTGTSIITSTTSLPTSAISFAFILDDVPDVGEFTSLFDSYMITGVMLQIKMLNNPDSDYNPGQIPAANQLQSNNFYPTIWYSPDHDDNSNISLSQIKEYERARHKVLRPNQELNIMLRPTTLTQVYRTSLTTGYSENAKRTWLDIAQGNIPHYGIKIVFDYEGLSPPTPFLYKVNAKLFFGCKAVR